MEARLLVGCLSVAAAFACALAGSAEVLAALRARMGSIAAQGEKPSPAGLLAWRVRNGYAFAFPLADVVVRVGKIRAWMDELVAACAAKGWIATRQSMASVAIVWLTSIALVAGIAFGSPIAALALPACAVAGASVVIGGARDKRREAARDAVPVALESMAACFGSGFTLLQTFRQVAGEVPGPLGELFGRSASILEMGGGAEAALEELVNSEFASELSFVAVALDVQHRSGGAMRQVLDAATDTVKGELALRRSLRVQTAQARLSARIVAIMPFILIAAFSVATPDFLTPFFGSVAGYALLALAIVMQVAGIVLVRRALDVDGVS